jgi:hypothetical protein
MLHSLDDHDYISVSDERACVVLIPLFQGAKTNPSAIHPIEFHLRRFYL